MQYEDADVFVYQIMDCLVSEYDYKIVNVAGSRRDIWLANEKNMMYPMIRLTPSQSTSAIFEKEYLLKIKKALSSMIQSERPLLIVNTNEGSLAFVEEDVVQMVATSKIISDPSLTNTFPALLNVIHEVENNQDECAQLMRHMESEQMQKVKEATKFKWKEAPKLTLAIIFLCVISFIISNFILNDDASKIIATLVTSGGYYKAMVIYGHEYWRLFTSIFIHYDMFTLLFYGISLYQLGKIIEHSFSPLKYILIFFLSAIVGNMSVLVFTSNNVSFGMGGGLFGILACFIIYVWDNKLYKNPITRMRISQTVMITLLALFFTGSSPVAFVGGFITGLFLSIMLNQNEKYSQVQKHFYLCGAMCLVFLGYGVMSTTVAYPEYKELDKAVIKEYKRLGLENYSKHIDNYLKEAYEEK